jgi:hypothetical protein
MIMVGVIGFAIATVIVESEVVFVSYDELNKMCHDRCITPSVFAVQTGTTIGEEHSGETFIEPDVGAVAMKKIFTTST